MPNNNINTITQSLAEYTRQATHCPPGFIEAMRAAVAEALRAARQLQSLYTSERGKQLPIDQKIRILESISQAAVLADEAPLSTFAERAARQLLATHPDPEAAAAHQARYGQPQVASSAHTTSSSHTISHTISSSLVPSSGHLTQAQHTRLSLIAADVL